MDSGEGLEGGSDIDELLAAPLNVQIPVDDLGVIRRVKALAATGPIHDLERNKAMWSADGIDWDRYDLRSLALATIDAVALTQSLASGMPRQEVVGYCAAQAGRQNPDADDDERGLIAERVIDALVSDQQYSIAYADHARTRRSEWGFRLFDLRWRADGVTLDVRATQEAINVLLDGLDVDVESAQQAAETQMTELIRRGALDSALAVARRALKLTVYYLESIATIVRDTMVEPDAHDWGSEVPELLAAALDHVQSRIDAETRLLASIEEQRDSAADATVRRSANGLISLLGACRTRHSELQRFLLNAREKLRQAIDERYSAPAGPARADIEADLLMTLLSAPTGAVVDWAEELFARFSAAGRRWWPSGAVLLDELLAEQPERPAGEPIEEPEFAADDADEWWLAYWDLADGLIDAITRPVLLSEMLDTAAEVATARHDDSDGEPLDPVTLAAAVCHSAHIRLGAALGGYSHPEPVVVAVPSGQRLAHPLLDCDDLLLVPALTDSPAPAGADQPDNDLAGTTGMPDPATRMPEPAAGVTA